MKYWDSSALALLLIDEPGSARRLALLDQDPDVATWWGSGVECASALHRVGRETALEADRWQYAWDCLHNLASDWIEVEPSERLRRRAIRLMGVHPLRAGDALQLAAALVASEENPAILDFVCGDARLADAARREGFRVW